MSKPGRKRSREGDDLLDDREGDKVLVREDMILRVNDGLGNKRSLLLSKSPVKGKAIMKDTLMLSHPMMETDSLMAMHIPAPLMASSDDFLSDPPLDPLLQHTSVMSLPKLDDAVSHGGDGSDNVSRGSNTEKVFRCDYTGCS